MALLGLTGCEPMTRPEIPLLSQLRRSRAAKVAILSTATARHVKNSEKGGAGAIAGTPIAGQDSGSPAPKRLVGHTYRTVNQAKRQQAFRRGSLGFEQPSRQGLAEGAAGATEGTPIAEE